MPIDDYTDDEAKRLRQAITSREPVTNEQLSRIRSGVRTGTPYRDPREALPRPEGRVPAKTYPVRSSDIANPNFQRVAADPLATEPPPRGTPQFAKTAAAVAREGDVLTNMKTPSTAPEAPGKFLNAPEPAPQSAVRRVLNTPITAKGALSVARGAMRPAAAAAAPILEGYSALEDIRTPGMTTGEQVGRGIEAGGRLATTAIGALGGSSVGPLGTIGGGLAGYYFPEFTRNVYNWATGNNAELPSDRANVLREKAQGLPPIQPKPRGIDAVRDTNAFPVEPQIPAAQPRQATPSSVRRSIESPTARVPRQQRQQPQAVAAPSPDQYGPEQYVVYTNAPGNVSAFPGSNIAVVGPGERYSEGVRRVLPQDISEAQAPQFVQAGQQGLIDVQAPMAAKSRYDIAQQNAADAAALARVLEQSRAGIAQAGISAGPGMERARLERELSLRPTLQAGTRIKGIDPDTGLPTETLTPAQQFPFDPKTGLYQAAPLGQQNPMLSNPEIRKIAADPNKPQAQKEKEIADILRKLGSQAPRGYER